MPALNITSKSIVIDTTDYAGNFERWMCAFVTGQHGDCAVGRELAARSAKEIRHLEWWNRHIRKEADEYGCRRPVSAHATPGWFCNGMGYHYPDDPAFYATAIEEATSAMDAFQAKHSEHVVKRIADGDFAPEAPGARTKQACEREIEDCRATVRRVAGSKTRHPAYLSVAIFVDAFPDDDILEELKLRAQLFCDSYPDIIMPWTGFEKINLTGFRLIDRP